VICFSKIAVYILVVLTNKSAKFRISCQSQTPVQMQVPGAIIFIATNSKITSVPDNFLIRDNDLI
jgi:hypothetical protein